VQSTYQLGDDPFTGCKQEFFGRHFAIVQLSPPKKLIALLPIMVRDAVTPGALFDSAVKYRLSCNTGENTKVVRWPPGSVSVTLRPPPVRKVNRLGDDSESPEAQTSYHIN